MNTKKSKVTAASFGSVLLQAGEKKKRKKDVHW